MEAQIYTLHTIRVDAYIRVTTLDIHLVVDFKPKKTLFSIEVKKLKYLALKLTTYLSKNSTKQNKKKNLNLNCSAKCNQVFKQKNKNKKKSENLEFKSFNQTRLNIYIYINAIKEIERYLFSISMPTYAE